MPFSALGDWHLLCPRWALDALLGELVAEVPEVVEHAGQVFELPEHCLSARGFSGRLGAFPGGQLILAVDVGLFRSEADLSFGLCSNWLRVLLR